MGQEIGRILPREKVAQAWITYRDLDEAFGSASDFSNVPTHLLVLPTNSRWTVLWNNSFLCNGYDSLCFCLTKNHGLTTVHWSANDTPTCNQPGATFTHRRLVAGKIVERSVFAAQEDSAWRFGEFGPVLPEEDTSSYQRRRVRDRLSESRIAAFLGRLGAAPWSEEFYALPQHPCFALRRLSAPRRIVRRPAGAVIAGDAGVSQKGLGTP
jgi:hypothetical protein